MRRKTHVVAKGESLHTIALRYYGSMGEYWKIIEDNKLQSDMLYVGQKLKIRENKDELE